MAGRSGSWLSGRSRPLSPVADRSRCPRRPGASSSPGRARGSPRAALLSWSPPDDSPIRARESRFDERSCSIIAPALRPSMSSALKEAQMAKKRTVKKAAPKKAAPKKKVAKKAVKKAAPKKKVARKAVKKAAPKKAAPKKAAPKKMAAKKPAPKKAVKKAPKPKPAPGAAGRDGRPGPGADGRSRSPRRNPGRLVRRNTQALSLHPGSFSARDAAPASRPPNCLATTGQRACPDRRTKPSVSAPVTPLPCFIGRSRALALLSAAHCPASCPSPTFPPDGPFRYTAIRVWPRFPNWFSAACAPAPAAVRAAARLMSVLADAPHRLPEVFHAAARVRPGGAPTACRCRDCSSASPAPRDPARAR